MSEIFSKGQLTSAERVKLVCQDFQRLLEDLTFNCRPLIEDLTKKASFHVAYAPQIVKLLEDHVIKVKPTAKLPALYLIDSIMKNLNGDYLRYFTDVIPVIFCHVFEVCVDPPIRKSLYKLRTSWNNILPPLALYAVDDKCHSLDENWPVVVNPSAVTPSSPKNIFVNRQFLPNTGPNIHINPALAAPPLNQGTVKTSGAGSGSTLPKVEVSTQPVAEDREGLRMKRLEVLEELGRKKEKLLEEDRHSSRVKSGERQNSKSPTSAASAGSKHVKPIESESKEKRPRYTKAKDHHLQEKGIVMLRETLSSLASLSPEKLEKRVDDIQNKAEDMFKGGLLSRADYSEFLSHLDKVVNSKTDSTDSQPQFTAATDSTQTLHKPSHETHAVISHNLPYQATYSTRWHMHPHPHTYAHSQHLNLPGPVNAGPPVHGRPMGRRPARSRSPSPHRRDFHNVPPPHPDMYHTRGPYFRRGGPRRGRGGFFHDPWHPGPRAGPSWDHSRPRTPPPHPQPDKSNAPMEKKVQLDIPDLPFEPQALKKPYKGIVDLIHAGDACSSCGMRFAVTSEMYSKHLDWHYKQNKLKEKTVTKGSRNWYIHPEDWMTLSTKSETESLNSGEVPGSQEGGEVGVVTDDPASVTCKVLEDDSGKCALCQEPLEQCWDEDEENWFYKEAKRGPDQQAYHVTCCRDAKEMKVFSPVAVTPSTPARNLTNLVAQLFNHNILIAPAAPLPGRESHGNVPTSDSPMETEAKFQSMDPPPNPQP